MLQVLFRTWRNAESPGARVISCGSQELGLRVVSGLSTDPDDPQAGHPALGRPHPAGLEPSGQGVLQTVRPVRIAYAHVRQPLRSSAALILSDAALRPVKIRLPARPAARRLFQAGGPGRLVFPAWVTRLRSFRGRLLPVTP